MFEKKVQLCWCGHPLTSHTAVEGENTMYVQTSDKNSTSASVPQKNKYTYFTDCLHCVCKRGVVKN